MDKSDIYAFINGKIFTSNILHPFAESMFIQDGRILWIGMKKDMPAAKCTSITDLKGKRVIPGFVDAHMHAVMLACCRHKIAAMPPAVNSIRDLEEMIKRQRELQGSGKWIEAWGYDEQGFEEKRSPDRYDLDRGCSDSPVIATRTCAHICCVNSKALAIAGIDSSTQAPPGGQIDKDISGEPTGILRETAVKLISRFLPSVSEDKQVSALTVLGKHLSSQGITSVCDMGNLEGGNNMPVYLDAAKKGFHQKAGIYYMWDTFSKKQNFSVPQELFSRDRQIFAAGLKLIADGSVSGKTAWMGRPYRGSKSYFGISVCSDELLESAIKFCKNNCCQLSVHAMGRRAITRIIDRLSPEKSWTKPGIPYVRIEHAADPSPESLRKASASGISILSQPIFPYAESSSYLKNLGDDWFRQCYPFRRILDYGVKLGFSTDAPATYWSDPSDPFPGLKMAVTRTAADGTDCGKNQAVSIEEAIRLYTCGAASAAGFPDTGMLAPGFYADFLILNKDILIEPPEHIDCIKVDETYIKGKCIYRR